MPRKRKRSASSAKKRQQAGPVAKRARLEETALATYIREASVKVLAKRLVTLGLGGQQVTLPSGASVAVPRAVTSTLALGAETVRHLAHRLLREEHFGGRECLLQEIGGLRSKRAASRAAGAEKMSGRIRGLYSWIHGAQLLVDEWRCLLAWAESAGAPLLPVRLQWCARVDDGEDPQRSGPPVPRYRAHYQERTVMVHTVRRPAFSGSAPGREFLRDDAARRLVRKDLTVERLPAGPLEVTVEHSQVLRAVAVDSWIYRKVDPPLPPCPRRVEEVHLRPHQQTFSLDLDRRLCLQWGARVGRVFLKESNAYYELHNPLYSLTLHLQDLRDYCRSLFLRERLPAPVYRHLLTFLV